MFIKLRKAKNTDLENLQQLFVGTIKQVCKSDYTPLQIEAWIANANKNLHWSKMLKNQEVYVALNSQNIIGFISLKNGCHIDFLFTHKDYQKLGVAASLCQLIEKRVIESGATFLTADVSITAKLFFVRMGFKIISRQTIIRNRVELTNYKMKKNLIE